jgi:hypothetical protein
MAELSETRRAILQAQNLYARGRVQELEGDRFWASFPGVAAADRPAIVEHAITLVEAREALAAAGPNDDMQGILSAHGLTFGPNVGEFSPGQVSTWEVTVRVTRPNDKPFWFRERGRFDTNSTFGSLADYLAAQLGGIAGRYPGAEVEVVSDLKLLY